MLTHTIPDIDLIAGFLDGLRPDPRISVREWADTFRILPDVAARPGKFNTGVTPYVREPMERLSVHDPAQRIVIKKSSQVGFTEVANNWLGYVIDVAPAPMLYAMPTDTMMKDTSKNRIAKMIESTPSLTEKISPSRSRDQGNTLQYKEFKGGFVKMVGANSPVGLSSTAVRYVYMDEIDRYPLSVGGEGSALSLAETRTITFGARKKIFLTSTPTIKGISAIDAAFEPTGQRFYHVPCPHCNSFQVLDFYQLRYTPGNYKDVQYECIECKQLIEERHKTRMMNAGKWIAKFPDREDGTEYGYFINALYSPYGMYSWANMAKDYEESRNDIPKLIAFTNTKLGEVYEAQQGEKPDWEQIQDRAEDFPENRPFESVAFLTAGVDVQADRLEIEVVGWMKGKSSQSIEYITIIGDTSTDDVWAELTQLLNRSWIREGDDAILSIRLMAVDTGYNTLKVYEFTQKHSLTRVIPIKGRDKLDQIFSAPKTVDVVKAGKKIGKVKVWGLGVSTIKSEIYGFLKLRINHETGQIPDGYCYFPTRQTDYFRGLTAEEIVQVTNKKGFEEYVWVKKYKRNEPLDCRVYARAAAAVVGMDRWTPDRWEREMSTYERKQVEDKKPKPKPGIKKAKSGFWNGGQ
jgi:phage terminase large subunit GpA-like protein